MRRFGGVSCARYCVEISAAADRDAMAPCRSRLRAFDTPAIAVHLSRTMVALDDQVD